MSFYNIARWYSLNKRVLGGFLLFFFSFFKYSTLLSVLLQLVIYYYLTAIFGFIDCWMRRWGRWLWRDRQWCKSWWGLSLRVLRVQRSCKLNINAASAHYGLDQFHVRCLRQITHVRWQDNSEDTDVLEIYGTNNRRVAAFILATRLRQTGHVVRMSNDWPPKQVVYSLK